MKPKVQQITSGMLAELVDQDKLDTVLLCAPDMQGRLQGKRVTPHFFLDQILEHKAEGCNYLLAVDVEMRTVSGYEMSSWEQGYGDFVFSPDMSTIKMAPWEEKAVIVIADLEWEDGSEVVAAPRSILKRQLEKLADRGLKAYAGTELEFLVFKDTYEDAWSKGYRNLTPANFYNIDYSMLGTGRVERLIKRIRMSMDSAGIPVENSKGECNLGQHEINFGYQDALKAADNHVIYKEAAKSIAWQEGYALTFMPKYNDREGNSCHIHLSLRDNDNKGIFCRGNGQEFSEYFENFLAGLVQHARELALFFAPNINSYKRYAKGSFAPTAIAWGRDNRTCAFRVVGNGASLRVENRLPGGDVNPYLAIAGMIASGLDGIEKKLKLADSFSGNAYEASFPRIPDSLQAAAVEFENSEFIRTFFGSEVQQHYLNMARVEIEAFNSTVTDWERYRCFERM